MFADEVLRAWAAVQFRIRVSTVDIKLGGQPIAKGDGLILAVGAANRNETVFPEPQSSISSGRTRGGTSHSGLDLDTVSVRHSPDWRPRSLSGL